MRGTTDERIMIAKGKAEDLMRNICLYSMDKKEVNLNDIRRMIWDIYRDELNMIEQLQGFEEKEELRKRKRIEIPVCLYLR